MITIEQITEFFGWCSVINIGLLVLSTILLIAFSGPISAIHSKLLHLEKENLQLIYTHYLSYYKIAIIMFNITPYIALKLMN